MFLSHLKEFLEAITMCSKEKYDVTNHFDLSRLKSQVDNIKIFTDNCNLNFIQSNSESIGCKVYITDKDVLHALRISCKYESGTIEIKVTFESEIANAYLDFDVNELKSLEILSKNGNICINSTKSKYMKIETTNGNVCLDSIESNDTDITSKNGNIIFSDGLSNDCSFVSNNGNIVLQLDKEYNLCLSSKNGRVVQNGQHDNSSSKAKIFAKTQNGNIVVE